jgi:hypothetical protein
VYRNPPSDLKPPGPRRLAAEFAIVYTLVVERIAEKFRDFESANQATLQYYRSLTPAQRIDILLELIHRAHDNDHATEQGLARVYRIVKLSRG